MHPVWRAACKKVHLSTPAYAFLLPPVPQVRVVILGQDPYINQGEAMGLCFSVPPGACATLELFRKLAQAIKMCWHACSLCLVLEQSCKQALTPAASTRVCCVDHPVDDSALWARLVMFHTPRCLQELTWCCRLCASRKRTLRYLTSRPAMHARKQSSKATAQQWTLQAAHSLSLLSCALGCRHTGASQPGQHLQGVGAGCWRKDAQAWLPTEGKHPRATVSVHSPAVCIQLG